LSTECTLLFEPLQRNHDRRDRQAATLHDLVETERATADRGEDPVVEGVPRLAAALRWRAAGRPFTNPGNRPQLSSYAPPRMWARCRWAAARLKAGPAASNPLSLVVENTQGVEDVLRTAHRRGALVQERVRAD